MERCKTDLLFLNIKEDDVKMGMFFKSADIFGLKPLKLSKSNYHDIVAEAYQI